VSDRVAPVEVRNYRPADLAACRSLWVELTEWHRQIYGSPEIGGADPGRKFDEHLERVGAQRIWLATIDGGVVGMVGVIQTEDEIELEPIVVSEQWRGGGIGRQLAERVVAEARAAGMGQLLARPVAGTRQRFASSTTSGSMRSASSNSCSISDPRPIRSGVWERRSLTAIYGSSGSSQPSDTGRRHKPRLGK